MLRRSQNSMVSLWGRIQIFLLISVASLMVALPLQAASAHEGVFRQAAVSPMPPTLVAPVNGGTAAAQTELRASVYDGDGDPLTVTFYGRELPATPPPDFTIVVIPDTQHYTCGSGCPADEADPATFDSQIQWILDNQAAANIQYVTHVGDMVDHGSNPGNEIEWQRADQIVSRLEAAVSSQFPDGIPYGVAVGNKDQGDGSGLPGETYLRNQTFGVDRFQGRSYYGGHYGSTNDNYYTLFQVGGIKFLGLYLEYDTAASSAVLSWADSVVKAYPDRWVLVTSHYVLKGSGVFSYQGDQTYKALRKNPNLMMLVGGHITAEARRSNTYDGRTVHTLLSDYQDLAHGGDGWFRIMRFSPANGTVKVQTFSSTRLEYQLDSDSDFTLSHDVIAPPFQKIATLTNVASGEATASWPATAVGKRYEWFVVSSDGQYTSVSQRGRFTAAAPTPTPTATSTATPTATPTATATSTPTPTATFTPTPTATSTPTPTDTPTVSPTLSPTSQEDDFAVFLPFAITGR